MNIHNQRPSNTVVGINPPLLTEEFHRNLNHDQEILSKGFKCILSITSIDQVPSLKRYLLRVKAKLRNERFRALFEKDSNNMLQKKLRQLKYLSPGR